MSHNKIRKSDNINIFRLTISHSLQIYYHKLESYDQAGQFIKITVQSVFLNKKTQSTDSFECEQV